MEINRTDLRIDEASTDFMSVYIKQEGQEHGSESSDAQVITEENHFCAIKIEEDSSLQESNTSNRNSIYDLNSLNALDSNLNAVQHDGAANLSNILSDSITLGGLDPDLITEDTKVFIESDKQIRTIDYNVPTVAIPSAFLEGLNLNVKKETSADRENSYVSEWLCDVNDDPALRVKVLKGSNQDGIEVPTDVKATITPVTRRRGRLWTGNESFVEIEGKANVDERRIRIKANPRQDYRERLRRKAECMREKRKKLYEQESEEQRLQRLAREAAKRREMRMYYETPEQRRKRLDAEAARKREYRMYNETPEERRKRLDREAERRRLKRLTLYTSETPEQRRERLNRESAKRREARLNQYAKETEEQRRERLRRDALRAREMRFTRSAIETEEERRQRLVKDALRKRELRMHGGHSVSNFTQLHPVHSFEELNNVQMKDEPDNQLGSHYLSNWMMWFQNTLTQPVHIGEQIIEPQPQNNG